MTHVRIVSRLSAEGHPCTDLFIVHEGRSYYSRVPYATTDSPMERALQVQQFLRRRQRFVA